MTETITTGYLSTMQPEPTPSRTKQWFNLAVPSPTYDNVRMQLACHIEEVCEMFDELEFDGTTEDDRKVALPVLRAMEKKLKAKEANVKQPARPGKLLDSICDQRVTGMGLAHMLGYDIDGAIDDTDDANFSKFVDGKPIFNEQGKIAKGPNWYERDLLNRI